MEAIYYALVAVVAVAVFAVLLSWIGVVVATLVGLIELAVSLL